ncbi:MAG: hypothetical protein ABH858_03760 [Candidatus Omnitrophota bacterium]
MIIKNSAILVLVMAVIISNLVPAALYGRTVTFTENFGYSSRYVWRGLDLYPDNDQAFQPALDLNVSDVFEGYDLNLNLWGAHPLSGGHQADVEVDYTLSLSKDIFDGNLTLTEGHTYFDFSNLNSKSDVSEPWARISSKSIVLFGQEISFSIFGGYDFAVSSGGPDEGWY